MLSYRLYIIGLKDIIEHWIQHLITYMIFITDYIEMVVCFDDQFSMR